MYRQLGCLAWWLSSVTMQYRCGLGIKGVQM